MKILIVEDRKDVQEIYVDLVAFNSDWLYPSTEMQRIYEAIMVSGGRATFQEFQSIHGHDAFLMENEEFEIYLRDIFFT